MSRRHVLAASVLAACAVPRSANPPAASPRPVGTPSIRPAVADVLSVTLNPLVVANPGDPIAVTADVFNTANVARDLLARLDILDSLDHVVGAPKVVPIHLLPGAGALTLS